PLPQINFPTIIINTNLTNTNPKTITTLLKTLEIHRAHRGTSIIEKFLSELTQKRKNNGDTRQIYECVRIEFVQSNIPIN
ncbi:hypothetical protein DF186_23030, partial [Enterococcus hirae]